MIEWFNVGYHIEKGIKLSETLEHLKSDVPHQIFLTEKSIHFKISEDEITKCSEIVERKNLKIFVHTPYTINLASDDKYIIRSLKQHLTVSSQMKFKGCVVHVGKLVRRNNQEAMINMRENIIKSIEAASIDCPLLLETPAGQGTEMLTHKEEFMDFVLSINDDRLGVCVDTCHVFSSGYMPMDYINYIFNNDKMCKYLKLFHYNDSEKECNSCLDRHSFLFQGKIPMQELISVAFIGQNYNIPLVIEFTI
jgi:deoxyribonuclease IV